MCTRERHSRQRYEIPWHVWRTEGSSAFLEQTVSLAEGRPAMQGVQGDNRSLEFQVKEARLKCRSHRALCTRSSVLLGAAHQDDSSKCHLFQPDCMSKF